MKAKRNTYYALWILRYLEHNKNQKQGISTIELCKNIGARKRTMERLCIKMTSANLLRMSVTNDGSKYFAICDNAADRTILDLIFAVEDRYSVFDYMEMFD